MLSNNDLGMRDNAFTRSSESALGAFISLKDSSIPTETYFSESYDELKRIKQTYSADPYNHFRTRKTII